MGFRFSGTRNLFIWTKESDEREAKLAKRGEQRLEEIRASDIPDDQKVRQVVEDIEVTVRDSTESWIAANIRSWDLTFSDDGETVPLTSEGLRAAYVPLEILIAIRNAINADIQESIVPKPKSSR